MAMTTISDSGVRGHLLSLLLIAALGAVVYANTLHSPFVFDDARSIVENPVIRDLDTFLFDGAGYRFSPRRFVGYLSLAVNYQLGGLRVTGYHLFNIAVHIVTALLVYELACFSLATPAFKGSPLAAYSRRLGLAAGLLFVVHPVQTQAVTYIIQRLASLATLFYLLATVCYLRGRLLQVTTGRLASGRVAAAFAVGLLAALAAVKTKEIAFTLPLVLGLYELLFFGAGGRKKVLLPVVMFLVLVVVPLVLLGSRLPAEGFFAGLDELTRVRTDMSRLTYLFTQFRVVVTYVRLLFWPVNQNLTYDYPVYDTLLALPVLWSVVFLATLAGAAIWLIVRSYGPEAGRGGRLIGFGILWFFITLAVESSLIPIVDVIFEHRLYLPVVGVALALAMAGVMLTRAYPARVFYLPLAVVVGVLAVATWQRNAVWATEVSLWEDCVRKSPTLARPHRALGAALLAQGRSNEAQLQLEEAIRLDPYYEDAYLNLGLVYEDQGWLDKAAQQYRQASRLKPANAKAHYNLGALYNRQGLDGPAVNEYLIALELQPDMVAARYNLGCTYGRLGRPDAAIRELEAALQTAARIDYAQRADLHFSLGVAYADQGRWPEAIAQYEGFLRLAPADYEAHNLLGEAYAKVGRRDKALAEFQAALQLRPDYGPARKNYARIGGAELGRPASLSPTGSGGSK